MSNRKEFEVWYLDVWGCTEDNLDSLFEESHHGNEYYRFGVRLAWQAWQKATKQAEAKCAELAAENACLKSAFDKPQAYLSWHAIPPTWEDPLPSGEYLNVHDDAGHKNSDGTDCWPVYAKPEIETQATDAFLAEVRDQGLNTFIQHHSAELDAHIKNGGEQFDEKSVRIRDIIVSARLFMEQIRQEAAQ